MKRLLLLASLASLVASTAIAQVPRRVLVEEFTSSTCPPCAATEPYLERFQQDYADKITMLKWHVNWPSPGNDPFYAKFKGSSVRSTGYYGNQYAPHLFFGGTQDDGLNTTEEAIQGWKDITDNVAEASSPFSISLNQEIVGDSIIANITVKAEGDVPAETDLVLAAVVTERFAVYTGTNGLPYHDNVVRTVVPGLTTNGALVINANYPALTMAKGETKVFRYAAKIDPVWNRTQLTTSAFIQSVGSKEVYQSATIAPSISVERKGIAGMFTGESTGMKFEVKNNGTTAQTVVLTPSLISGAPASWVLSVDGTPTKEITLGSNESKEVTVTATAPSPAVSGYQFGLYANLKEGIGAGGAAGSVFGKDNTDLVLTSGITSQAGFNNISKAIKAYGSSPGILALDDVSASNAIEDWKRFRSVFLLGGDQVALYTDTGDTLRIRQYVEDGGNFFFSSSAWLGVYSAQTDPNIQAYPVEVFHLNNTQVTQEQWNEITGVEGDPIGNGLTGSNMKVPYRQSMSTFDNNAHPIFVNELDDTVGVRVNHGNGKIVYLGFGIENLSTAQQAQLTTKIMDWFMGVTNGVNDQAHPTTYALEQNYPNPFNPSTSISYTVADRSAVSLVVRDVMGREVSKLIDNKMQDAGSYSVKFDASNLPSGTYFYTLTAGEHKIERKMTLNK